MQNVNNDVFKTFNASRKPISHLLHVIKELLEFILLTGDKVNGLEYGLSARHEILRAEPSPAVEGAGPGGRPCDPGEPASPPAMVQALT